MYPHVIRLRGPWEYRTLDGASLTGAFTPPGFWRDAGLPDYWGAVNLRRGFNWVAKPTDDEVVWLCLDRCVGATTVRLNGVELGSHDFTWGAVRYSVNSLLRDRNQLEVDVDAPLDLDRLHDRYGSLGCREGDAVGSSRKPVGGILGEVALSVESRRLALREPRLATGWSDAGGSFELQAQLVGTPAKYTYAWRLDDQPIASGTIDPAAFFEPGFHSRVIAPNVEPWWPRTLGASRLHRLTLSIESGSETLFERTWSVGFRTFEPSVNNRWRCNGRDFAPKAGAILPDRTYASHFGEDPAAPFDQWYLARHDLWRVVGHYAPERFYALCDRAGLLLSQDTLPAPPRPARLFIESDWNVAAGRLASHPSVIPS